MTDPEESPREGALDQMLQGGPRSQAWRQWREALERRLTDLRRQKSDASGPDAAEIGAKIEEMEQQINALATEEIISEFVESEIDLVLNSAEDEEGFGDRSGDGMRSF